MKKLIKKHKQILLISVAVFAVLVVALISRPYIKKLLSPVKDATLVTAETRNVPALQNDFEAESYSAPVADDSGVYFITNAGLLFATDHDLHVRWFAKIPGVSGKSNISPALFQDTVTFFIQGGRIIQFGKADGKVRWSLEDQGDFPFDVVLASGAFYFSSIKGAGSAALTSVSRISAITGQKIWSQRHSEAPLTRPLLSETSRTASIVTRDLKLDSLNKEDGSSLWELQLPDSPHLALVNLTKLTLVRKSGMISVDTDTGQTLWQSEINTSRAVYDRRTNQIIAGTSVPNEILLIETLHGGARSVRNQQPLEIYQSVPEGVIVKSEQRLALLDPNIIQFVKWAVEPIQPKSKFGWHKGIGYVIDETGALKRVTWGTSPPAARAQ